jgi:hypothetical protein
METTPNKWEWTWEKIVSPGTLDKQLECFQIAMLHNSHHAMRAIDLHIHPLMKLWQNLSLSPMLPRAFSEYFKVVKLAMIMVLFSLKTSMCARIYCLQTCLLVLRRGLLTNITMMYSDPWELEDERTFSNVSYLKNKLKNCITDHLLLCATIFVQQHFILNTSQHAL